MLKKCLYGSIQSSNMTNAKLLYQLQTWVNIVGQYRGFFGSNPDLSKNQIRDVGVTNLSGTLDAELTAATKKSIHRLLYFDLTTSADKFQYKKLLNELQKNLNEGYNNCPNIVINYNNLPVTHR